MPSFRNVIAAVAALVAVGSAANYTITAKSDLTFSPDTVTGAVAGDFLIFQFEGANHSVASGGFNTPCNYSMDSTGFPTGFWSGYFFQSAPNELSSLTYEVMLTATMLQRPVWFYCTQGKHCANGMAGVVNPTAELTLDAYKSAAAVLNATGVTPNMVGASPNGAFGRIDNAAGPTARVSTAALLGLVGFAALLV